MRRSTSASATLAIAVRDQFAGHNCRFQLPMSVCRKTFHKSRFIPVCGCNLRPDSADLTIIFSGPDPGGGPGTNLFCWKVEAKPNKTCSVYVYLSWDRLIGSPPAS